MVRAALALLPLALLASCMSTGSQENPIYQSSAIEERGERAISSQIKLAAEVQLSDSWLGVFHSRELFSSGEAQNVLFVLRERSAIGSSSPGEITDYQLRETASLSVDQAQRFLDAIEEYLAKQPTSLDPSRMMSYELYSGVLDMSSGTETYRPFKTLTFGAICSVTNAGKRFQTVFPYTYTSWSPAGKGSYTSYRRYDLTTSQVQKLRDAIVAALAESTPIIPQLPAEKPGS